MGTSERCNFNKIDGKVNVREYRMGNQRWSNQRNWQHRVHKTKTNQANTQHKVWDTTMYRQTNTNNGKKMALGLAYHQRIL